jgi:microcystin degradation protein MlrC
MPLRIAVGSILQESNSFSPLPTVVETFEQNLFLHGAEMMRPDYGGINISVPAIFSVLKEAGVIPVPLIAAEAIASGPLTRATFETLMQEMETRLRAAGRVDGLLLSLHGALMVEDDPRGGDGEIIERMRNIVGPDVPIGISFDLHGHMTQRILQPNCFHVGFQNFPHTDIFETGQRLARLMLKTLAGTCRPVMALAKRPMVVSPACARTTDGPLLPVAQAAREFERTGAALHVTLFPVQPWLDIPDLGFAVLVCADNDMAKAQSVANTLADMAWNKRHEFDPNLIALGEAVRVGLSSPGVTVVGDAGDSPNGGSGADHTGVLRALLDAGANRAERLSYLTMCDPPAAALAHRLGVGATGEFQLGHHFSTREGRPVSIRAEVLRTGDGEYQMRDQDLFVRMGPSAVLAIGSIRVLVRTWPSIEWDRAMYSAMGLAPEAASLIFVKSPGGFRFSFEKVADRVLIADTPGPTCANMSRVPYSKVTRPLFPLDPI